MATPDTATVPALGDVHDSVAFSLLDDLKKAKKLTEEEHAQYKSFYELLHNRVIETHEKERTLLKLSRRKQNDVLGEKIKLERAIEKLETETRELDTLEAERERVQKDLDDAEQKDTVNKYELAELERTHTDLTTSKDDLEKENKVTVLPELERLRAECENIKEAYKRQDEAFSKEAELKAKFLERNESLDDDLVTTAAELNDSKDALLKAQAEPQRIRKQVGRWLSHPVKHQQQQQQQHFFSPRHSSLVSSPPPSFTPISFTSLPPSLLRFLCAPKGPVGEQCGR